jgi:hypothetical protein
MKSMVVETTWQEILQGSSYSLATERLVKIWFADYHQGTGMVSSCLMLATEYSTNQRIKRRLWSPLLVKCRRSILDAPKDLYSANGFQGQKYLSSTCDLVIEWV